MSAPIVLFYHQIVEHSRPDHYFFQNSLTAHCFRQHAQFLKEEYQTLHLDAFIDGWRNGHKWPNKSVLITFDDGFANGLIAARILHDLGLSATFFVLSDTLTQRFLPWYMRFAHLLTTRKQSKCSLTCLGEVDLERGLARRRWLGAAKEHLLSLPPADRDAELNSLGVQLDSDPIDTSDPDYRYFDASALSELINLGMTIGSHTASHDNLCRCTAAELQREVVGSKAVLEDCIGRTINTISYPDGRFNARVESVVAEHYQMAFSASPHLSTRNRTSYPRRPGDRIDHPRKVLSSWYPMKRAGIELAKRCFVASHE